MFEYLEAAFVWSVAWRLLAVALIMVLIDVALDAATGMEDFVGGIYKTVGGAFIAAGLFLSIVSALSLLGQGLLW